MKHLFIINPLSFQVQALLNKVLVEIRDCFAERREEYDIYISRYPRDAIGYIRNRLGEFAIEETIRVYAVGGDGILFDCLNGIVGLPNMELAIVPYGTANDVVRAFGENKNTLFRNIRLQASAPVVPMDIISCGNNYALNFCTVGIESDTNIKANAMFNSLRGKLGKFPRINTFMYNMTFFLCGISSLCSRKLFRQMYNISLDGDNFSGVYGSINIANGPCYGGNKTPSPAAIPDDGMLDAVFFQCRSHFRAFQLIMPYMDGGFRRFPENFIWKRLRKISIRSLEPLLVDLDGEVFIDTNLTVEIIPHGVRIAAPGDVHFVRRVEI